MALGDGFAAALKDAKTTGFGDIASLFERVFTQMREELRSELRDEIIAEVRAEVQRAEANETVDKLATAFQSWHPVVNVAAPPAPNVTVTTPDVTVNPEVKVPKPDAPKVTIAKPKSIRIVRDEAGQITGAEVT